MKSHAYFLINLGDVALSFVLERRHAEQLVESERLFDCNVLKKGELQRDVVLIACM
jgi:hypothetical protein